MNPDREAELRAAIDAALDELQALIDAKERERAQAHVGRCFAYRNCYSCPSSEADYWTLYLRVVGVTPEGTIRLVTFQTDKDGNVRVDEDTRSAGILGSGYKEISHAELVQAWNLLRRNRLSWFETQLLLL
jgi:hypothetical protein